MKYAGYDKYVLEPGEPIERTCPLCYPEQGKPAKQDAHHFFFCPLCGRFYLNGKYADSMSRDEFDALCAKLLEHVELEGTGDHQ